MEKKKFRSLLRGALTLRVALSLAACSHDPIPPEDAPARDAGASDAIAADVGPADADASDAIAADVGPADADASDAIAEDVGAEDAVEESRAAPDGSISCGALPRQRSCPDGAGRGCGVVCIPGGTFTMGDGRLARGNAGPEQPGVAVGTFVMDRYEVTVARYRRFWTETRGGAPIPGGRLRYPAGELPVGPASGQPTTRDASDMLNWSATAGDREHHPLNGLNWEQAQEFCWWDAGESSTSIAAGRLPTEAEWELAARGTEARKFPWGDESPDPSRVCGDGSFAGPAPRTCEVDVDFAGGATPLGLMHMAGNVAEWTADRFCPYGAGAASDGGASPCPCARTSGDPLCGREVTGPSERRVLRGGGWEARGDEFAAAARIENPEANAHPWNVGFRCVRSVR